MMRVDRIGGDDVLSRWWQVEEGGVKNLTLKLRGIALLQPLLDLHGEIYGGRRGVAQ